MTLPQQDKPLAPALQLDESATAPPIRQPTRMQRRLAALDAAELEASRWQNRLKLALYVAVMGTAFVFLFLLAYGRPAIYPRDVEGLGILFGVSLVLVALFSASYCVNEWVESRVENYWIWRTASVLLFLGIAGGMLYAMFANTDFWLPHFR